MSLFKNTTSVSLFLFHEWPYCQWNIVNFSDLYIAKAIQILFIKELLLDHG